MRLSLVAALCLALVGCTPDGAGPIAEPSEIPTVLPSPTQQAAKTRPVFPAYGTGLPREPEGAANALVQLHQSLPRLIGKWLRGGGSLSSSFAQEIHRGALWQQRLYRRLAHREKWSQEVIATLRGPVARVARRHIEAQRALSSLVTPLEPPIRWKTHRPESPHVLRRFYEAGERRYGVPWQVLAAVNAVESRFGRILGPSSAGASGPMQFIPSTWEVHGADGDIMDPHDSIIAAARYLSASGAPERLRDALYAYNRSYEYVDAILTYAGEIQRDERNYFSYYFWEVFVATTKGDLQLTGPGGSRRPR